MSLRRTFNPTMVRLLRMNCWASATVDRGFNPTMVRLLPGKVTERCFNLLSFNPTMVRLLLPATPPQPSPAPVSIPQWCDCCLVEGCGRWCCGFWCFNPTMVRLLQNSAGWTTAASSSFQSHNGAIAARLVCFARCRWLAFQSHNGAIAAIFVPIPTKLFPIVSIPQWCDCCPIGMSSLLPMTRVSIPQWCDCCAL